MGSLKPIEGSSKNISGQPPLEAETLRESYLKRHFQKAPATGEGKETPEIKQDSSSQLNKKPLQARHTYAEFEVNRETHEVTVRIIDADSGTLVRTIPPEDLMEEITKGNLHPNRLRRRAVLV